MIGKYILYFENGEKYLEGYREGDNFSQINSCDKVKQQTLINGNGFYIRYDDNGKIIQKEIYKDGKVFYLVLLNQPIDQFLILIDWI